MPCSFLCDRRRLILPTCSCLPGLAHVRCGLVRQTSPEPWLSLPRMSLTQSWYVFLYVAVEVQRKIQHV